MTDQVEKPEVMAQAIELYLGQVVSITPGARRLLERASVTLKACARSETRSNSWIPVGERLPEPETMVTVWVGSYYQGKGGHDQAMLMSGEWRNMRYSQRLRVTHWMPLPAAPEPKP